MCQPSCFGGRRQGDACSREGGRAAVAGGGAKTSDGSPNFRARFSTSDSTWNQLLSSLCFQPYPDRSLKVVKKCPHTSCNPRFETWFRPIGGEFEDNDSRLLIVVKNPSKWYIYCLCSITFWKSHFSRWNCQLALSHFTCKANRDSKSKCETSPGLVLMPWIQWRSQIFQKSYGWKAHFSR